MIPLLVAVGVAGLVGVTTRVLSNDKEKTIKKCRARPIRKDELPTFLQEKLESAEQNNYKNNK